MYSKQDILQTMRGLVTETRPFEDVIYWLISQGLASLRIPISHNGEGGIRDISVLGSKNKILFSLRRGGKDLRELIQENRLDLTPSELSQVLIKEYGIYIESCRRARGHEWFARKISDALGRQKLLVVLMDQRYLQERLSNTSVADLAVELGLTEYVLEIYLSKFKWFKNKKAA